MTRFFLAWQFLTVLPGWRFKGEADPRLLGPSMACYPLIGLLLGLVLWISFWFLVWVFPKSLADGLLLLLLVLLTGAFHLDGLADTLDGLAHGRTPEERMQIMKDHRVGAFGVIGLILILGIKFLALNSLTGQTAIQGLVAALALSRYSMVQMLYRSPYARKEGGLGLTFKENCPDVRNTKIVDVVRELEQFGAKVDVYDPWADSDEAEHEYGLRPVKKLKTGTYDAVVMGVAHDEFRKMGLARIRELARKNHVLYDIKYVFKADEVDGRL